MSAAAYQAAEGAAAPGQNPQDDAQQAPKDENIMDADYKVVDDEKK